MSTFDTKQLVAESAASPVTSTFDAGDTANILVIGITTTGTTARAGGTPTFNGVALTQAGTAEFAAEGYSELRYLLAPAITSSTLSVPNTGAVSIQVCISTYISSTGYFEFDVTSQASGTTDTPTTSVTPTGTGIIVDSMFTGDRDIATANNRTLLYSNDTGSEGNAYQYYLNSGTSAIAMSYTQRADDWAIVAGAFIESAEPSSPPTGGLYDNLVSYYKADTNGSFPDIHGSNNCTISGATYDASGKINGAYDLDGVNDSLDLPSTMNLFEANTSAFAWCKFDNFTQYHHIFDRYMTSEPNNRTGFLRTNNNNTSLYLGTYNSTNDTYGPLNITLGTALTTGTWYHIGYTFDGTTYRLYLNGVEIGNSGVVGTLQTTTFSAKIGKRNDNWADGFLNGMVDEVGIWETELTSTQVTDLYNSGSALSYDDFGGGTTSTNFQINIGDSFKTVDAMKINIGGSRKEIVSAKVNVGDLWKDIF